ncbi:hypothetical protein [Polyangium spumosum]|uniref:Uncharacterized protein n=1 Tax=Polyangium spumosum TaxID=889282 RepID=A0A6N7PN43_9BACT|nr:hypothetical protein [Polyangium spumosum]MRG91525.1 hypothetical protein [Polyangium spumosum]
MQAHPVVAPGRVVSMVRSLDELIGAHPESLRRFYATGNVVDPSSIGEGRGRVLALVAAPGAFLAVRSLVRLLATDLLPWQGKAIDAEIGWNLVKGGRRVAPFRVERADSSLDGGPTLVFRYDDPAQGHAWPVRALRDELRVITPGLGIGPVIFDQGGAPRVIAWWGLSFSR